VSSSTQAQRRADRRRRALDLILGSVLLVLATPVMLVVALGCSIALRAQPVFVQDRIGRNGATFRFVKLRTLSPDVPPYVDKHQLDQARIPRFCRLVRRLHLDELPQLLLVVRGRMSLVGPRPEMAHLHSLLPADLAAERTSVRPGCTGFWQVSDACTGLIGDAPEYDRWYVTHRGAGLDLWVLWHTLAKMIGRPRYPRIADVPFFLITPELGDLVEPAMRHEPELVAVPVAAGR
jgi:lipopolysaccharide/colanic/teichoic acid biosynthesis glycosyltransferase